MLAPNRRPMMRNFFEWITVPVNTHLFDWLERAHGIDTAFVFSSVTVQPKPNMRSIVSPTYGQYNINLYIDDPLDLMNALSDHGHDFGKWTAAYLRRRGETAMPVIFFSQPQDSVLFRLHYGEETEIC